MYFVYALTSEIDHRIYVGLTADLTRRLVEHNSGSVFSTKGYRPWTLLYTEHVTDRTAARKKREVSKIRNR